MWGSSSSQGELGSRPVTRRGPRHQVWGMEDHWGAWWGLALQMRWAWAEGAASAEASVLVGMGVSCVADSSKLGDI